MSIKKPTKAQLIKHLNTLSATKLADDYAYITSSDLDRALWWAKDKEYRPKITEKLADTILVSWNAKNLQMYLSDIGFKTKNILKPKTMSTKKTPKRTTAKKLCSSVIVREGLKKDGSLKKGYRYAEGGKIVKAKPVKKVLAKKKVVKTDKYIYNVVFQTKKPAGKWTDRKTFKTDSTFELGDSNDRIRIDTLRREYKSDLPTYETRTIKRKVLKK